MRKAVHIGEVVESVMQDIGATTEEIDATLNGVDVNGGLKPSDEDEVRALEAELSGLRGDGGADMSAEDAYKLSGMEVHVASRHEQLEFRADEMMRELASPTWTLRELAYEARQIDAILTATDGELTPELEERLDAATTALSKKPDGIRDYLFALESTAKTIREEEKRLAERRRIFEAREERFRKYVISMLQLMERDELMGTYGELKLRNNPPKLVIDDRAQVPAKFVTTVTPVAYDVVDEDAMKAELVAHEKAYAKWEKDVAKLMKAAEKAGVAEVPLPPAPLPPQLGAHLTRGVSLTVK